MAQNSGFLFSVVHSTSFVRRISKFRESLDHARPWRRLFHLNSNGCEISQIVCLMAIENFVTWDCPDNDNFCRKGLLVPIQSLDREIQHLGRCVALTRVPV